MNKNKLVLIAVLAVLVAAYFGLGLGRYLTLDFLKSQQAALAAYVGSHPVRAAAEFFVLYVAVTGLSLPGATVMTLVGGAAFGLALGTVIVSFASSIGATLAFLASRYLFRDAIRRRHGARLAAIDQGIAREGAFYLFTLRLVPAVPFFLINVLMGLTPIRTAMYYGVSQLGMLPGTLVYVNAGTQLAQIESLRGILSPGLVASFTLLGLFPLVAKRLVAALKARKGLGRWPKPGRYDRNVVVIGAGSAGLVSAYIAAAVKAKVTLVEQHRMGGDCLNTGCVPSKALIRTAKFLHGVKRASELGVRDAHADFSFAEVMERVQRVVREVEPHDSVARYEALGVECLHGRAQIVSPYGVSIATPEGTRTLTTRAIVIAAGARPFVPPIPGLAEIGCLTSDTVWSLRELPKRLVVLGGGPIGCELAQCFSRLGSQVTQVEMLPRLLVREDPEIAERVLRQFQADGIDVRVGHKAQRCAVEGGEKALYCDHEGREVRVAFDAMLCAVGRVANTAGYGLEELGIPVTKARTIEVNEYLQTLYPGIYACGDAAGPYQFTHTASHTAWYATVNALFGGLRRFRADFSVIPWATFTDPEVARVGLNETEAKEKGIAYEVTTYDLADLDRAIADGAARGIVKVLTAPGKDRILGATIAGERAGDLIAEFVVAMRHGLGLGKLLGTIHVYPTYAEAAKYAAGAWKRAHVSPRVLGWLARYHAWRRG
jgi:pyruvate/2-oxoglutarate dehydrogenase complex dihydrolipoamide dehydrogenase (E3) component/uncharacterized membrane protein YdjX (TVP38/TMEM64 family)